MPILQTAPVVVPPAVALFQAVCLAGFPRIEDAPARLRRVAPSARPVRMGAPLFGGVLPQGVRTWTASDGAPGPDRYLVVTSRSELDGRPARACLVADKRSFPIADTRAALRPVEVRDDPAPAGSEDVLRQDVTTWRLPCRGGAPVLLSLTRGHRFGDADAPSYAAIAVVHAAAFGSCKPSGR